MVSGCKRRKLKVLGYSASCSYDKRRHKLEGLQYNCMLTAPIPVDIFSQIFILSYNTTETIPDYDVLLQDRALGKFQYCSGDDDSPGAWIFTVELLHNAFTRDDNNEDCGKSPFCAHSLFQHDICTRYPIM